MNDRRNSIRRVSVPKPGIERLRAIACGYEFRFLYPILLLAARAGVGVSVCRSLSFRLLYSTRLSECASGSPHAAQAPADTSGSLAHFVMPRRKLGNDSIQRWVNPLAEMPDRVPTVTDGNDGPAVGTPMTAEISAGESTAAT